jgi:EAL domain-containing protein (putative c-di-GMP-specific phosphodiesterase class I)
MICFEITETAAIANLASALDFIEQAKALGCRIALDDFGAGLSSFSYLKTIPADFLKIDGSFVADMLRDPMDSAIVEAIHRIARVAGLQTIAEFVESDAIRQRLVEIGVDYAQGYGIHPPEALAPATVPLPTPATRG